VELNLQKPASEALGQQLMEEHYPEVVVCFRQWVAEHYLEVVYFQ
jgi:hypothetical protein